MFYLLVSYPRKRLETREKQDDIWEICTCRAGKLLDEILLSIGIERQSVYVTNTIKCRPPDNRNPNLIEINNCQDYLSDQINLINPLIIITLGKIAANAILKNDLPLNILRGMFGANGYGYPDFSNFSVYIILILLLSVIITFVSKNTNYLIENFNSFNLESKISK